MPPVSVYPAYPQHCEAQTQLGYPCPGFAMVILHQTALCFWHAPHVLPQKAGAKPS